MAKIDKVIIRETLYIFTWTVILSAITQAIFLIVGAWDYTVLLGNLLSGIVAVLNFFALGLTVNSSVHKEEKESKQAMKVSFTLRTFAIFVVVVLGVLLDCFSIWTVIIPLFFPRIAIAIRMFFIKKSNKGEQSETEN